MQLVHLLYIQLVTKPYTCSAQSTNLFNLEIALHILRSWKLHANLEIEHWGYRILRSCNFCWSSFEFPSCIKVRKYIRSSCSSVIITVGHVFKPPIPKTSGKFTNSEKFPSPQFGYAHRETPDLWSVTISELSSVSQLRRSHPVSLLYSQIVLV